MNIMAYKNYYKCELLGMENAYVYAEGVHVQGLGRKRQGQKQQRYEREQPHLSSAHTVT